MWWKVKSCHDCDFLFYNVQYSNIKMGCQHWQFMTQSIYHKIFCWQSGFLLYVFNSHNPWHMTKNPWEAILSSRNYENLIKNQLGWHVCVMVLYTLVVKCFFYKATGIVLRFLYKLKLNYFKARGQYSVSVHYIIITDVSYHIKQICLLSYLFLLNTLICYRFSSNFTICSKNLQEHLTVLFRKAAVAGQCPLGERSCTEKLPPHDCVKVSQCGQGVLS